MKSFLVLIAMLPLVAAAQPTPKTTSLDEPVYIRPYSGKTVTIPGLRSPGTVYVLHSPVKALTAADISTIPTSAIEDTPLPPQPRGCLTHNPAPHYRDRSGAIYFIDGVKVEPIGPATKQCTMLPRQRVVIDRIDLRLDMNNPTTLALQRKDIMRLPYTDLTDMVSLSTSVHQRQRGAVNHINAGRPEELLYVIDGMQVARW